MRLFVWARYLAAPKPDKKEPWWVSYSRFNNADLLPWSARMTWTASPGILEKQASQTWVRETKSTDAISSLDDGDAGHLPRKLNHHQEVCEMIPISHTKQRRRVDRWNDQWVSLWIGGSPEWPLGVSASQSIEILPWDLAPRTFHCENPFLSGFYRGARSGIEKISEELFCKGNVSHFQSPNDVPFLFSRSLNKFQSQILWAINFPTHPLQHGTENFHFCVSI